MNIKTYKSLLLLGLFTIVGFYTSFGQSKDDKKQKEYTEIHNLVNSKNYVFVAQTVLPIGGRSINLTSPYNLKVSGDTVVSDLPYFGRAFVAPIDPSEAGIQFTSTNFNYNLKERKKGGWDIAILPKDTKDVRQMTLNVTEGGYGTLQVISNNKQQISYNGYIRAAKSKT